MVEPEEEEEKVVEGVAGSSDSRSYVRRATTDKTRCKRYVAIPVQVGHPPITIFKK